VENSSTLLQRMREQIPSRLVPQDVALPVKMVLAYVVRFREDVVYCNCVSYPHVHAPNHKLRSRPLNLSK
jgi:hypothetical protein